MTEVVQEIVIGATLKEIERQIVDADGDPLDISGGAIRLVGVSDDIAAVIDVVGSITDGPNGLALWDEAGGTDYVEVADLGEKSEALFRLRTKFTDAAGKIDFGAEFFVRWVAPPDVTPPA
jgi:hypothetical protein